MNSISKITSVFVLALLVLACNNKPKPAIEKDASTSKVSLQTNTN